MRAKFVLRLEAIATSAFPSDEQVEDRLRSLGLGMSGLDKQNYEDRRKVYVDNADGEWTHLPEVAEGERDHVVFYARLANHARLLVTRPLEGAMILRVIHDDLDELERSSAFLITELAKKSGNISPLDVVDNVVEIYERGSTRVILVGRVIAGAFRETSRRNPGDVIAASVTGVMSIVTVVVLAFGNLKAGSLPRGTFERFSTAMMASFFIATVNFVQHWLRLKRHGSMEWSPASANR